MKKIKTSVKRRIKRIIKKNKHALYPSKAEIIAQKIAKEKKVGYKAIAADMELKEKEYGISYNEYYDKKIYNMTDAQIEEMLSTEKEWFATTIAKITSEDRDSVLERMENICTKFEISYRQYFKKKYYNMHEVSILNMLTVYSDEYVDQRVRVAAKRTGKSRRQIRSRMNYLAKRYGVTKTDFVSKDYCFFSADRVQEELSKIDFVDLLSKESGKTYEESKAELAWAKSRFGVTEKVYKNRLYYTMDDQQIYADIKARKDELFESIEKGAAEAGLSLRKFMLNAKVDTMEHGITLGDYVLFKMYDKSEEERKTWINYDADVRNLKRKYRLKESDILENKVRFNKLFSEQIGRKWWTNSPDTNFEEFKEFLNGLDEIIVKPIAAREGKGIEKIELAGQDVVALYETFMSRERLIIEECIKQHHSLSEFYPNCVHCCRIVAVLDDNGKCHYPQTSIKFGVNAVSDNLATGGLCANIDLETGKICTDGATKKGEIVKAHPYNNKVIKGFEVPYWKEILALAEDVITKVPDINLIGFDIAITENGPVIIEGNDTPDFRVYEYPLIGQRHGMRYKFEPLIEKYECQW